MLESRSLSNIRILISNDDGVHAEGIKVLEKIAKTITPDVWVVAPEKEQSGKGGSATFDNILRIHKWDERKFSVTGTPTDNVHLAVDKILTDKKPDLVLSGINRDSNLGNYLMLSGTLGAAFAGSADKIRSIAISQSIMKEHPVKYNLAEHFLPDIIKRLYFLHDWNSDTVMNVNFPCCPLASVGGIRVTRQANVDVNWFAEQSADPHGYKCYWMTSHLVHDSKLVCGTDIEAVCYDNYVSITPLRNDLTNYGYLDTLKEEFYAK